MSHSKRAGRWVAAGLGLSALTYAVLVAIGWVRYGHGARRADEEADALLDRFMPDYEIVERHQIRVEAPPAVTLAAAGETDPQQSAVVRAIFRAREIVLGAGSGDRQLPKGLLEQMKALGWGVLLDQPGHEIVMGAVTQPWQADVVFRAVPPDEFKDFQEPGYVKIAWTLRAEPIGDSASIFRTETRAATTDPAARARFRWYWARFAPGIVLIRRFMLPSVKREAERRQQVAAAAVANAR